MGSHDPLHPAPSHRSGSTNEQALLPALRDGQILPYGFPVKRKTRRGDKQAWPLTDRDRTE